MLFKEKSDKYGLANRNTQVGNLVCVLHGSDFSMFLIRHPENTYQFIGQCDFESCMHGEAVNWEEDEAAKFIHV